MKTLLNFLACLFLLSLSTKIVQAASNADQIIGFYSNLDENTGEANSQMQIFKAEDGKYYGKIVWAKDPYENGELKLDKRNPDKTKRDQPYIGLVILKGFSYDVETNEWIDGVIYNPETGKTYNGFIKFTDEDDGKSQLHLRGYVGKSWMGLGRSIFWPRSEPKH